MQFFIAIVNFVTLTVEIVFTMRFYRHTGKVLLPDESKMTKIYFFEHSSRKMSE